MRVLLLSLLLACGQPPAAEVESVRVTATHGKKLVERGLKLMRELAEKHGSSSATINLEQELIKILQELGEDIDQAYRVVQKYSDKIIEQDDMILGLKNVPPIPKKESHHKALVGGTGVGAAMVLAAILCKTSGIACIKPRGGEKE